MPLAFRGSKRERERDQGQVRPNDDDGREIRVNPDAIYRVPGIFVAFPRLRRMDYVAPHS